MKIIRLLPVAFVFMLMFVSLAVLNDTALAQEHDDNHEDEHENGHEEHDDHGISSDEMMMNLGVVFGAIIVFCLVVIFYPKK